MATDAQLPKFIQNCIPITHPIITGKKQSEMASIILGGTIVKESKSIHKQRKYGLIKYNYTINTLYFKNS